MVAQARPLSPSESETVNSRQNQQRITDFWTGRKQISTSLEHTLGLLPKGSSGSLGPAGPQGQAEKTVGHTQRAEPWTWQPARKTGNRGTVGKQAGNPFPSKKPQQ